VWTNCAEHHTPGSSRVANLNNHKVNEFLPRSVVERGFCYENVFQLIFL